MTSVKNLFSYRWLIGAFIALFFALQSYSLSHATSFGDAPHNHDGIDCTMTVIAPEEDISLPAETVQFVIESYSYPTAFSFPVPRPYSTIRTRAPPPRAPPTLF